MAGKAKKNILVISPTPSHPQNAGNRARIFSLTSTLRALGHNVFFLFIERELGSNRLMREYWEDKLYTVAYNPATSGLRRNLRKIYKKFNIERGYLFTIDEWYDPNISREIEKLSIKDKIDVVIVEYVFFSKALKCFGDQVLKIIDTHDVFTERHRRFLRQNKKPAWFSTTRNEEKKGLERADKIIAIQNKERAFFEQLVGRKVITVGHVVPLDNCDSYTSIQNRILYVGSKNEINLDAVKYFIDDIFPKIRMRNPEAELAIAGNICDYITDQSGVIKLGMLDSLDEAYQAASVVVNPIQLGTGLKIKNIEALGFARPLVTTSVGAEGLDFGGGANFLIADTAEDFSDAVLSVLMNKAKAKEFSDNAFNYAQQWNEACLSELNKLLQA